MSPTFDTLFNSIDSSDSLRFPLSFILIFGMHGLAHFFRMHTDNVVITCSSYCGRSKFNITVLFNVQVFYFFTILTSSFSSKLSRASQSHSHSSRSFQPEALIVCLIALVLSFLASIVALLESDML